MRISVALAARNSERYLGPLLESLARQTKLPTELVACDDASEDSTPEILTDFAEEAPFPVHLERFDSRRGHVATFIHAARSCHGDAIAFCDADDVWLDRKLEVCAGAIEQSQATLVLHSTRLVDAELHDLGATWPPISETRLVPPLGWSGLGCHTPGMAMVFRPEILSLAPFEPRPPSRYGLGRQMVHDEWVFFLAGVIGSVQLIAEPLVLYRQHGANTSSGGIDPDREWSLRPALADYLQAAELTGACAEYLEAVEAEDDAVRDRLAEGARAYRRISENWALRGGLYGSAGLRRRARLLRQMWAAGAYGPRTGGGFGRAALGKDLVAGVALGLLAPGASGPSTAS